MSLGSGATFVLGTVINASTVIADLSYSAERASVPSPNVQVAGGLVQKQPGSKWDWSFDVEVEVDDNFLTNIAELDGVTPLQLDVTFTDSAGTAGAPTVYRFSECFASSRGGSLPDEERHVETVTIQASGLLTLNPP